MSVAGAVVTLLALLVAPYTPAAAQRCIVPWAMSNDPAAPIAGDELPGAHEIVAEPDWLRMTTRR